MEGYGQDVMVSGGWVGGGGSAAVQGLGVLLTQFHHTFHPPSTPPPKKIFFFQKTQSSVLYPIILYSIFHLLGHYTKYFNYLLYFRARLY